MKVSIIIITKNQKEILQKSIPVLLKQRFNEDDEVIVVDSGSTDGAIEYVKNQPVKLVEIKPAIFNYAEAFNIGAKMSKGEFLIRLSGDVIPVGANFIKEMIIPFEDLKVGGTYGRYVTSGRKGYTLPFYWPERRFPKSLTYYSAIPNLFKYLFYFKHREEVTNFAGGCCAVRNDIWGKRPFNNKLSAAEDAEYALYLHLAGYSIVCNPKAIVLHEHEISREKKISNLFFSKWAWQLNLQMAQLLLKKWPKERELSDNE